MMEMGFLIGGFVLFGLIVFILISLMLVFWVWMLIDCLKRNFRKDNDKIVWALVIIFLYILGASIYYFVIKINEKKTGKAKKK
jgi:predicted membrane channel-forming protein YqfA (hemolysin III family)